MKIAVREGRLVVPTCPECGCRLNRVSSTYYTHFYGYGVDARGHKCSMLTVGWQKEEDSWKGTSTSSLSPWAYMPVPSWNR